MHASGIIVNIGMFGLCGALLWYIGFRSGSSKGDSTGVREYQQHAIDDNRRITEAEHRDAELKRQQAGTIEQAKQGAKRASKLIQEAKNILGI